MNTMRIWTVVAIVSMAITGCSDDGGHPFGLGGPGTGGGGGAGPVSPVGGAGGEIAAATGGSPAVPTGGAGGPGTGGSVGLGGAGAPASTGGAGGAAQTSSTGGAASGGVVGSAGHAAGGAAPTGSGGAGGKAPTSSGGAAGGAPVGTGGILGTGGAVVASSGGVPGTGGHGGSGGAGGATFADCEARGIHCAAGTFCMLFSDGMSATCPPIPTGGAGGGQGSAGGAPGSVIGARCDSTTCAPGLKCVETYATATSSTPMVQCINPASTPFVFCPDGVDADATVLGAHCGMAEYFGSTVDRYACSYPAGTSTSTCIYRGKALCTSGCGVGQ